MVFPGHRPGPSHLTNDRAGQGWFPFRESQGPGLGGSRAMAWAVVLGQADPDLINQCLLL